MSRDRPQVSAHNYAAPLAPLFCSLARSYDKRPTWQIVGKVSRVSRMFGKQSNCATLVKGAVYGKSWRMVKMSLWPLLDTKICVWFKVTSTTRRSSCWAEGSLTTCLRNCDCFVEWRENRSPRWLKGHMIKMQFGWEGQTDEWAK